MIEIEARQYWNGGTCYEHRHALNAKHITWKVIAITTHFISKKRFGGCHDKSPLSYSINESFYARYVQTYAIYVFLYNLWFWNVDLQLIFRFGSYNYEVNDFQNLITWIWPNCIVILVIPTTLRKYCTWEGNISWYWLVGLASPRKDRFQKRLRYDEKIEAWSVHHRLRFLLSPLSMRSHIHNLKPFRANHPFFLETTCTWHAVLTSSLI